MPRLSRRESSFACVTPHLLLTGRRLSLVVPSAHTTPTEARLRAPWRLRDWPCLPPLTGVRLVGPPVAPDTTRAFQRRSSTGDVVPTPWRGPCHSGCAHRRSSPRRPR